MSLSQEVFVEVTFEYKPQKADELQLRLNDCIRILDDKDPDWWFGESTSSSQQGWLPSNFVKTCEPPLQKSNVSHHPHSSLSSGAALHPTVANPPLLQAHPESYTTNPNGPTNLGHSSMPDAPKLARVLYDYEPVNPDELSLRVGSTITILSTETKTIGWFKGDCGGEIGIFPANHVKLVAGSDTSVTNINTSSVNHSSVETPDASESTEKKLAQYGVKVGGGIGSLFSGRQSSLMHGKKKSEAGVYGGTAATLSETVANTPNEHHVLPNSLSLDVRNNHSRTSAISTPPIKTPSQPSNTPSIASGSNYSMRLDPSQPMPVDSNDSSTLQNPLHLLPSSIDPTVSMVGISNGKQGESSTFVAPPELPPKFKPAFGIALSGAVPLPGVAALPHKPVSLSSVRSNSGGNDIKLGSSSPSGASSRDNSSVSSFEPHINTETAIPSSNENVRVRSITFTRPKKPQALEQRDAEAKLLSSTAHNHKALQSSVEVAKINNGNDAEASVSKSSVDTIIDLLPTHLDENLLSSESSSAALPHTKKDLDIDASEVKEIVSTNELNINNDDSSANPDTATLTHLTKSRPSQQKKKPTAVRLLPQSEPLDVQVIEENSMSVVDTTKGVRNITTNQALPVISDSRNDLELRSQSMSSEMTNREVGTGSGISKHGHSLSLPSTTSLQGDSEQNVKPNIPLSSGNKQPPLLKKNPIWVSGRATSPHLSSGSISTLSGDYTIGLQNQVGTTSLPLLTSNPESSSAMVDTTGVSHFSEKMATSPRIMAEYAKLPQNEQLNNGEIYGTLGAMQAQIDNLTEQVSKIKLALQDEKQRREQLELVISRIGTK